MIEKFNGIFYLIVFLVHFLIFAVYAYQTVFATKTFLDKLNSTISMDKYQNYVINNLKPDGENIGTEKIIRILKDKYKI